MTHRPDARIEPEDPQVHSELVKRLNEKIVRNRKDINKWDLLCPDSKHMIISYGSASFGAREVAAGDDRIGLLRLKTVWPLPEEPIREVASKADHILVCEMNLGQLFWDIKRIALEAGCKKIELLTKIGGDPPTPWRGQAQAQRDGGDLMELFDFYRKDRWPHVFCPGCGNGTVMNCFFRAFNDLGWDLDNDRVRERHRVLVQDTAVHQRRRAPHDPRQGHRVREWPEAREA